MSFRISDEAREEIRAAAYDHAAEAPSRVSAFYDHITPARALIIEHPNAHPEARRGCRRIRLSRHPCRLVCRVDGDEIRNCAVAHLMRRPRHRRGRVT